MSQTPRIMAGSVNKVVEPPSVALLIRAGHPVKAMVLSIVWRMPWRTIATIIGATGFGTIYHETLQHLRFW